MNQIEKLAITGAGGIIIKVLNGQKSILLQERHRDDSLEDCGLLEVPAGRIREFENIFNTLRREVKEETGLEITKIIGEEDSLAYHNNGYSVINYMPFSCSQCVSGKYPYMVLVFICEAEGALLPYSNESRNYKWISVAELKEKLENDPNSFFPMHVDTLKKFIASVYAQ